MPKERKRKGPFRIEIYADHNTKTPRIERRKTESEAQTLAKIECRRHASRVQVIDADGDVCWHSSYASSLPIAWPKR